MKFELSNGLSFELEDVRELLDQMPPDSIRAYAEDEDLCDCSNKEAEAREEGREDGYQEWCEKDHSKEIEPHVRSKYAGKPIPEPVRELVYEVAGVIL